MMLLGQNDKIAAFLNEGLSLDFQEGGLIPLRHQVTAYDQSRIVEWLLQRGADANVAHSADLTQPWVNYYSRNALHLAAEYDHLEIAEFLLMRTEIDIHQRDTCGFDAFALTEEKYQKKGMRAKSVHYWSNYNRRTDAPHRLSNVNNSKMDYLIRNVI